MGQVVSWSGLQGLTEPYYPNAGVGRMPWLKTLANHGQSLFRAPAPPLLPQKFQLCMRSMKYTYRKFFSPFIVASLARSSTAAVLRNRSRIVHAATAQVRGGATCRALGR